MGNIIMTVVFPFTLWRVPSQASGKVRNEDFQEFDLTQPALSRRARNHETTVCTIILSVNK